MADRDVCALCSQKADTEDYEYQDNGLPVHVACKTVTFWNAGERVVSRFWEPGAPIGTVRESRRIADTVYQNAFDDDPQFRIAEWVVIDFDDGTTREFMAPEVLRAPESA